MAWGKYTGHGIYRGIFVQPREQKTGLDALWEEKADKRAQVDIHDPDVNVLPPLSEFMTVNLMIEKGGAVRLLHFDPLFDRISWAEYDPEARDITLVLGCGKLQRLGLNINPDNYLKQLSAAPTMAVIRFQEDGNVADIGEVRLMVRESAGRA